jgi:hypothetical protein
VVVGDENTHPGYAATHNSVANSSWLTTSALQYSETVVVAVDYIPGERDASLLFAFAPIFGPTRRRAEQI